MAFSSFCKTEKVVSIDELVDYIDANIEVTDDESLFTSAEMLQGLANNKNALIDIFNSDLLKYDNSTGASYSQSSTVMGMGKKQPFIIRANMWPPAGDSSVRTIEEALFSYELPHDHNFSFLTANYFGPGYVTDIWECSDPASVQGYPGEHVPLTFLERTKLEAGKQMLFRRQRDIHTQHSPEAYSVSLNVLVVSQGDRLSDQFEYDVENQRIAGFPMGTISTRRSLIMEFAGSVGNQNTADILLTIAQRHPCQRTRAAALSSAIKISPDMSGMLASAIKDDKSRFVQDIVRKTV